MGRWWFLKNSFSFILFRRVILFLLHNWSNFNLFTILYAGFEKNYILKNVNNHFTVIFATNQKLSKSYEKLTFFIDFVIHTFYGECTLVRSVNGITKPFSMYGKNQSTFYDFYQ